jgi:hypothetical protein
MTGYLDFGANPLSAITIASMADLGYTVDPAAADPYGIAGTARPSVSRIPLHGDLLQFAPRRLNRNAKIRPPYLPPADR